jgi:hypothetical protein
MNEKEAKKRIRCASLINAFLLKSLSHHYRPWQMSVVMGDVESVSFVPIIYERGT